MPFTVNDIKFYLSGGAANSNPQLSLGGIISSSRILSQTTSVPVNITGLTILSSTNNAQGIGLLSWSPSSNTITWQPPGSAYTYSVTGVTANGEYTVGGGDGTLVVSVVYASMAGIYKQDAITITNSSQNVFDSVAPLDSLIGSTNYRCIYIKNTNATITANDVKVWIKQQTTGPDTITIGLDPAGVGNGSTTGVATTAATESTAPAGVAFTEPLSYSSGLTIGTLTPGQSIALWERRVVPADTTGDIAANSAIIGVALTV